MANTVTLRTIIDGPRTAVVHGFILSDGASGELTDQVVVDISALSGAPTKLTVEQVYYNFNGGCEATLEFDATADTPIWTMTGSDMMDFRCFGGIKDNTGAGSTGDIVLSTAGFTATTDSGTFVIVVRKD